jgi:hypothetical protein
MSHTLLAPQLLAAIDHLARIWARHAQERAERRWAAAQRASLSNLDAHTLRDLGLGDWAASRSDDSGSLARLLDMRGS